MVHVPAPAATPVSESRLNAATCALGSQLLFDAAKLATREGRSVYYVVADDRAFSLRSNLFQVCPDLIAHLPPPLRVASPGIIAQATAFQSQTPINVDWIEAPDFSRDLREATVTYGTRCPGLCGATFTARYVLGHHGWKIVGTGQMTAIS